MKVYRVQLYSEEESFYTDDEERVLEELLPTLADSKAGDVTTITVEEMSKEDFEMLPDFQ